PEHLRDGGVVVPVEVEQHERPLERAQVVDAAQQELHVLARLRGLGHGERELLERELPLSVPALAAMERDRDVEGDAVDPGRLPEALVVPLAGTPELHGDLLHDVLAIRGVPAIGVGDPVDQAGVAADEVGELGGLHRYSSHDSRGAGPGSRSERFFLPARVAPRALPQVARDPPRRHTNHTRPPVPPAPPAVILALPPCPRPDPRLPGARAMLSALLLALVPIPCAPVPLLQSEKDTEELAPEKLEGLIEELAKNIE